MLSCSTVSNSLQPMDCSPPDSSVHGLFQARILEQIALSYSRGSSCHREWTHVSCVSCIGRWILQHCDTLNTFTHYKRFLAFINTIPIWLYFLTLLSLIFTVTFWNCYCVFFNTQLPYLFTYVKVVSIGFFQVSRSFIGLMTILCSFKSLGISAL